MPHVLALFEPADPLADPGAHLPGDALAACVQATNEARDPFAELLEPWVRVSLAAAGSRHALVPDVQARDDRDMLLVAWRQQRAQPADRGGRPRPGQVLDHQARPAGGAGVGGEQAEGRLERPAPPLATDTGPSRRGAG